MAGHNIHENVQIGNYRLLVEIGSGGFGKVYRGQHIFLTDRTVAIKLLHAHVSSPEDRKRTLDEALLLEKLRHPNILHIFDVGIDDGFPYLVAEYAPGGSLRDRMNQYKPRLVPLDETLNILSQIGQALQYAHQQNIIHRDLKPENILFNSRREALLADFGIATTLTTSSVKAVTITGTPLYMAPEQFQGTVSKESDQYALGCIAYELVTGKVPFPASDFFTIGFKHLSEAPVPPWNYNPRLPAHIGEAILKAMSKQRSDRHASIQAFITALGVSSPAQSKTLLAPQSYSDSTFVSQPPMHSPSLNQMPASMSQDLTQASSPALAQQTPVTPLPMPAQTPPRLQESFPPVTPVPSFEAVPQTTANTPATFIINPVTPVPLQAATQPNSQDNGSLWSNQALPQASVAKAGARRGTISKRSWLIIAAACILLLGSVLGVGLLAFSPHNNPILSNTTTQQGNITSPQTTVDPPINSKTATGVAGGNQDKTPVTHQPTGVPSSTITAGPTRIPSPTITSGPTQTVTTSPTMTPISLPSETVSVPFTSSGVPTTNTYQGKVTITVSGTGEASQTMQSDAFYIFTDINGNSVTPFHPYRDCYVLDINGQPADHFTTLPFYNANQNHTYTFTINAPGGVLTFDECDGNRTDNFGSYTIQVQQN